MNITTKVAQNYILQVISKAISTILGLVAMALMARYLGLYEFGHYITIITFLSFFGILADLGLTLTTVQMISPEGANTRKILSNLLGIRFVSALLFLGIAPLIVFLLPYETLTQTGVLITAGSFFFIALTQILIGLFQKNLRMEKVAIAEVISRIVLVVGIALSAWFDLGLYSILIFIVLSSFVNFLLLFIFSRKLVKIRLEFDFELWIEIIKKSWPLAVTIGLNLIYLKADTLLLSFMKTEEEVGIYGSAYKVVDVFITLPFMFAGIVLPILTKEWSQGKVESYKQVLQKSLDTMIIIILPVVIGTQYIANNVMTAIAGKEFFQAGAVLKLLIIACAIIFVQVMFSHAVIAINKQKKLIVGYAFTAITALIGYLIFIPKYSYFGAAWVTIYSELVITLVSIFLVWKYTKFKPNFTIPIKALVASIVMSLFLYKYSNISIAISLPIASIIYFITLYSIKGLNFIPIKEILKGKL
ncbi:flippase [Patescibacteria group bacterium]|nr:flippase [Patescibacteria group bacterium]